MASMPPPTPSRARRFLAAYLQPLVFVLGFPLAFASALHAPAPHEMPVLLVGPTAVVAQATAALDGTPEFTATHTDDPDAAVRAVEDRSVAGSVKVDVAQAGSSGAPPAFTVTTYVASGGGVAATAVVRQVGSELAGRLGTTARVVDLAPLSSGDGVGTGLFFLLTYTSLGGYLSIISLMQFAPRSRLRSRYLASAITAVGAPLLVYGLSSIFVGTYGAGFTTTLQLLGVNALYVFTVGAAAILINQFLGKMATVGVMALVVFLNFPGSGGPVPASMLPPFWQVVHGTYLGGGALESFRSIIYFDGHGLGRWLPQLLAWTVGLVLVTIIVDLYRTSRRHLLPEEHRPRRALDDAASPAAPTSAPATTSGPSADSVTPTATVGPAPEPALVDSGSTPNRSS